MIIRPPHPDRFSPLASGLLVRKPPAPLRSAGISRHGMGRLPCWCCFICPCQGPPDGQAPKDGTAEWFTHEVDEDGLITRVDHEGPCFTCYVNSTSGDVDETGNGTETRPFVNLHSVFTSNITKSGLAGTLSAGVFTPASGPSEWAAGRLIGAKLTLDGTDYEITANTTTTATIDDPPADDDYDWTLKIFDSTCIYNICTTDRCPKVKVLVKGTIDYVIGGEVGRVYQQNLIIEPWGVATIAIDITASGSLGSNGVVRCRGCVWKNTAVSVTNVSGGFSTLTFRAFVDCPSSAFDNCTATCENTGFTNGISTLTGFWDCPSSAFDNCTATCTENGVVRRSNSYAFDFCPSSTFLACAGTGNADTGSTTNQAHGTGFNTCSTSAFDTCTGIGNAESASFAQSHGHGFNTCSSSTIVNCAGTGTGENFSSGTAFGYGFRGCLSSTFDTCIGTGVAVGTLCKRACGFHGNTAASFINCTTSARICTDCSGAQCAAWVCDI